ncbi:zinc finger protein 425-like [Nilaparvata lugens]|uniref:zinc finger protein 425-like n=1 Tax=Nilaparvata lugens TaxID=108931 RepID=UPI00193E67B3|nr:zinc finger protein 425-like [Nilaparvata lugens]
MNFNLSSEEDMLCQKCFRRYKSRGSLLRHLKMECGKLPGFQCPKCPYMSKQKAPMKRHIVLMHMQKDMLCQKCFRRYKSRGSLLRHLKMECGKLPGFQCPKCPYMSKQKAPMKRHIVLMHMQSDSI